MADRKKQHYVPQFYLRYFSDNAKTINCYVKNKDLIHPQIIKDICQENYFYNYKEKNCDEFYIESIFFRKEEKILQESIKILLKHIELRKLLSREEKEKIIRSILILYIRTMSYRNDLIMQQKQEIDCELEPLLRRYKELTNCSIEIGLYVDKPLVHSDDLLNENKRTELINRLSQSRWSLLLSHNNFITSDKPILFGTNANTQYLTIDNIVNYKDLLFTVSPNLILKIDTDENGDIIREVSKEEESFLNKRIYENAQQYVFSYNKITHSDVNLWRN